MTDSRPSTRSPAHSVNSIESRTTFLPRKSKTVDVDGAGRPLNDAAVARKAGKLQRLRSEDTSQGSRLVDEDSQSDASASIDGNTASRQKLARSEGPRLKLQSAKSEYAHRPVADTSMSSPTSRTVALLVASLGNPPPYHSTRHSAGHIVLRYLQSNLCLPPFAKSKPYGGGQVSLGADVGKPEFTLWQSPSLMNISGSGLLHAYKQFVSVQTASQLDPIFGVVILHDEMETEPGKIKVRRGGNTSAKGHNGIKSVQSSLSSGGVLNKLGDRFVKIGIGIGRPSGGSREPEDVSRYVLGQLTAREKEGLDNVAKDVENVLYQEMGRMIRDQSKL